LASIRTSPGLLVTSPLVFAFLSAPCVTSGPLVPKTAPGYPTAPLPSLSSSTVVHPALETLPAVTAPAPITSTLTPSPIPQVSDHPPRCVIQATRTPVPNAATSLPDLAATPRLIDPHIEICASSTKTKVGQLVTIMGYPVDLGIPYYRLMSRSDPDAGDPIWMLEVTYENQIRYVEEDAQPLEVVFAEGKPWWVEIVLRAVRPGAAEYYIVASGEIHYGYPGPASWGGGGSEPLVITVE